MTTSGEELLTDIGSLLFDEEGEVWDDDLKASFANEAIGLVVLFRPDATAVTETLALTADTPKQTIPTTGVRFLDLIRNIDGRPIRKIKREEMNEAVPAWTTTETSTAIEHFMFDEENPETFWVYPVPTTALEVEIVYSDAPTEFTVDSASLGISDIYLAPVKDYIMYRCLSMHTQGADAGKAAGYLNNFYTALGVKAQSDAILTQVQGV